MVLLQPDFDIPSDDDWVLLDSVLRNQNYDKLFDEYKISEQRIETIPIRSRFTINYCIPTWMWIVPIFLIITFIWIQYGSYLNGIVLQEDLQMNVDGTTQPTKKIEIKSNDFLVSADSYFYPTPSVPPPKYDDAFEKMLWQSDNEITADENISRFGNKSVATQSILAPQSSELKLQK